MLYAFSVLSDNAKIDEEQAERMILHCYESGVNYYDTTYPYHVGTSEKFVGKVYRKTACETKFIWRQNPVWQITEHRDFTTCLKNNCKLQTDYIDFYLMHSLNAGSWHMAHIYRFMDTINRTAGPTNQFSFHDNKHFKEIVRCLRLGFCQIQLNYMDENTRRALRTAICFSKGLPVVIMEPLKEGSWLLFLLPCRHCWKNNVTLTPVELALKLFQYAEVSCVLNGASGYEQIVENVRAASTYGVGV